MKTEHTICVDGAEVRDIESVHISEIKSGDAIFHNGKVRTVCNRTIRVCEFMGKTLFGDSYNIGYKLVKRVVF